MTLILKLREPSYEARLYDPSRSDSAAASLEAWILGMMGNAEVATVTATADTQGFSISVSNGMDAPVTLTGTPGDWIVAGNGLNPEVLTGEQLQDRYQILG